MSAGPDSSAADEPAADEPAPVEPAPVEPAPVEPAPVEPAPVKLPNDVAPRQNPEPPGEGLDLTGPPVPAEDPPEEVSWLEAPSERRCGFTFGLSLGANIGAVTGFPNDSVKLGREEFRVNSGFAGGGSANIWFGLAATDWLVFGGEGSYGQMMSSTHSTGFGSASFRIDAFPLFVLGDAWREVGMSFTAGLGVSTTTDDDLGPDAVIDSGAASRIKAGLFYEGIRFWKVSMGPAVNFDGMWSPTLAQTTVFLGWRSVIYGGP